tara:strand:- start:3420 stop:3935 length:516 start_codon:yes stop_codon:yes gene_type:complete
MKLDKIQRVILANQLKILEALYPDDAEFLAPKRTALEEGYALHYEDLAESYYDELPEEECKFVLDVLDMYRSITFSYREMEDKSGVSNEDIRFKGFDGNNETQYMAYCRYFIDDLGRFQELIEGQEYHDFNSHTPMIQIYRDRLASWRELQENFFLTKGKIKEILGLRDRS